MPIVDIVLVADASGSGTAVLAQSLADTVGRALKSPPGQTWVRMHVLPRDHYAENESPVDLTEPPVFVIVLKRTVPAKADLAVEVSALTEAIAQVLGRATNCVHVEYAPAAGGRFSFGGNFVEQE